MLIHIILGILKIIGILLLAVLGLFLLLVLSLLFVPVRYCGEGYKDKDGYEGKITVSWLFHLIWVQGSFGADSEGWKLSVRVLGIPLEKLKKILIKRSSGHKNRKKKKKVSQKRSRSEITENLDTIETKTDETKTDDTITDETKTGKTMTEETVSLKKEKEKKKGESWIRKIFSLPGRILKSIRNFRLAVRKICDKIKQMKKILDSDSFREAKTFLLGECKCILLHILPGKIKGELRFGCEDPALTGQILAAAGVFYPLYGKSLSIYPYFDRKILEGKVEFRGRMRGILFAKTAWRIFRNSNIKALWKKLRN